LRCAIVDDSLFIRTTVTKMIQKGNHKVVAAYENGKNFIDNYENVDFDILFLDIILPDMTGIDILRDLNSKLKSKKIIMLSGVTQGEAISVALRLGAIDFLQKPVNGAQLLELLNKLSDESSAPSVEQLSSIGVGCQLLNGFFQELIAHSSSTLRRVVKQQAQSILQFYDSTSSIKS